MKMATHGSRGAGSRAWVRWRVDQLLRGYDLEILRAGACRGRRGEQVADHAWWNAWIFLGHSFSFGVDESFDFSSHIFDSVFKSCRARRFDALRDHLLHFPGSA